jgi:RNA polymerase sigma-32 factor
MSSLTQSLPLMVQDGGLRHYLDEIKKIPMLSEGEEYDLAVRWHDNADVAAAHVLVKSHLRLVAKVAMQFKGYGLPMQDVISEGSIGLMMAVKKFNPHMGYRLSTYATWWIKSSIQNFVLQSWSMVKVGTSSAKKKLFFNLKKVRNRLMHKYEGTLPDNEYDMIARELGVDRRDVADMSNQMLSVGSLNDNAYGDDDSVQEIDLVAEPGDNQEYLVLHENDYKYKSQKLKQAFSALNERERDIITKRKLCDKPITLEELSKQFGVSTERIRQIEERAMQKMIAYVNPE